jgi:hypothetical protein
MMSDSEKIEEESVKDVESDDGYQIVSETIVVPSESRRLSERISSRMSSLRKTRIYSPGKIISGMKKSKKSKKKHKKPEWIEKK